MQTSHTASGVTWSRWLVSYLVVAFCAQLPTFFSDHLDELTDAPGRTHPPTRPYIPPACWRTQAVHTGKRETEHLFFITEREWVNAKWDRPVCVPVSAWQWQIIDRRSRREVTVLSDWQQQTHHCFSSDAPLVITSVCLILKVELLHPLRAGVVF